MVEDLSQTTHGIIKYSQTIDILNTSTSFGNTSVLHCSALIGIFLYPRERSRVRFGSITGVILKPTQST